MQTFRKEEHLTKEKIIDQLFNQGKSFSIFPIRIIWLEAELEAGSPVQVLISIPKKRIRKAVSRNLLKRRIREALRKNKSPFFEFINEYGYKCAFAIVYTSYEIATYSELEQKIILALQRLQSEYEKSNR